MKKLLLLCLFIAGFAAPAKAQAIYFSFDSIWSPPYICQAHAFHVEVFGTRSSGSVHDGAQNHFLRNDTVYVQFHFTSGMGPGTPGPLHRQILVPAPPIGQYKIMVQGFYNGQLHKTISTRLSVCAGIAAVKETSPEEAGFSLYPNPARDKIEITGLPPQVPCLKATVLDVAGKTLLLKTFRPGEAKNLAVSNLPIGIYLLKLQTDRATVVKKFVKE